MILKKESEREGVRESEEESLENGSIKESERKERAQKYRFFADTSQQCFTYLKHLNNSYDVQTILIHEIQNCPMHYNLRKHILKNVLLYIDQNKM